METIDAAYWEDDDKEPPTICAIVSETPRKLTLRWPREDDRRTGPFNMMKRILIDMLKEDIRDTTLEIGRLRDIYEVLQFEGFEWEDLKHERWKIHGYEETREELLDELDDLYVMTINDLKE